MAGVGRQLAEGMQNFAMGIMKEVDGKSLTKVVNKNIANGMDSKIAMDAGKRIAKSSGYEFGSKVASAKPMMGMTQTARNLMGTNGATKMGLMDSIAEAHKVSGKISGTRVAGTAVTAGVAGRVATGGGIYRDRYGNVNVPGVPFI